MERSTRSLYAELIRAGYEPDLQSPGSFPQFDGLIPHNLYSELSELSELTTSSASPSSTAVESGSEEEVELLLLQDTVPATTSRGVDTLTRRLYAWKATRSEPKGPRGDISTGPPTPLRARSLSDKVSA